MLDKVAISPSVVGSSARRSDLSPSSRSARSGFGPRVILRAARNPSRKTGSSSNRCAKPCNRRNPSPVNNTKSSNGRRISQSRTGAGSGASRIATSGQRRGSAPCSSNMCASRSSSRVSGRAMRRPARAPIAGWSLIEREADLGKAVVQDYSPAKAPQGGGLRMDREYETVRIDDRGEGLLLLNLNRREVANALNTQMGRDLLAFFDAINAAPGSHRCIVVTGAGERAFCAGGDLKERNGMTDEAWQDQHLLFERMIRAFIGCPVPVIGAVNGAAYAGGCEWALCCDFIYAAETARFALTEVTLGIMPGAGGTQNLPRAVGERRAKEMILTGRPDLGAPGQTRDPFRPADGSRERHDARDRGLQPDGPDQDRREGVVAFNEK